MISAANILHALSPFQQALQELQAHEQKHLDPTVVLHKSITLAYRFLTLSLKNENELHARITFEVKQDMVVLAECYVANASRKALLEKIIGDNVSLKNFRWSAAADHEYKNDTVITRCLAIADTIAGVAVNCARGDDYSPGCYSSMEITDEKIVLSQINRMNAKSLDHKNDYSLRDLEFTIPLAPLTAVASRFDAYQVGPMLVYFSDHSSPNNRTCGDRIKEQIMHAKAAYSA